MIEDPTDPWFIDKAKRRAAGESDVEFQIEPDGAPWIWDDHPHVLRSERMPGDEAWQGDVIHLWLPYPSWSDQAYSPKRRFIPARSPDIVISNVGKIPPQGFWALHPRIEYDRTVYDDDDGSFWQTSIWLIDTHASEAETAAMLADVLAFKSKREP